MSLYHKALRLLYPVVLLALTIYSYVLLDPNITLINNNTWTAFRNAMVIVGYYERSLSSAIYIGIVLLLTLCHLSFVKHYRAVRFYQVLFFLGVCAVFSYPFISHDLFNYMFDARILTVYHQNPYLFKALDFPHDEWLRFMHWTHRTYPYGPTFLPLTLIPSALSLGKLLLNLIFFKLAFFSLFAVSAIMLYRINEKWGVLYATNPLIIIEGLVNAHNDIVALSLAIIGYALIVQNKKVWGRIVLVISGGIKYITVPFIIATKKSSRWTMIILIVTFLLLAYLADTTGIQPWYFLVLLGFIPYYEKIIEQSAFFFVCALLSYVPYILYGSWDKPQVAMKYGIIFAGLAINTLYIIYLRYFAKVFKK
jgi:hypothetical protein